MITDRRSLLAGLALVAAGPAALAQTQKQSQGEMAAAPMINSADMKAAPQYFMAVLPRAELSLLTSQMAVEKATNKNAHEFAGFELGEAITVNMVIKDMDIAAPAMDGQAMTIMEEMKSADEGASFDRAYIGFQLANHEYLRDLADGYLLNTAGSSDMAEKHGRHLASVMLAVFKEHVAICKRITAELAA